MHISYSAPAKVILSGEHSVVYGKPALVSAIDLRLTCTVSKADGNSEDDLTRFISTTVQDYLKKKKIPYNQTPIKITFKSAVPSGRGLGSSAALSVAASAACLHFFSSKPQNREIINSTAYRIEKRFHANPSGVDTSTSCFGGLIFYRKEFEFLKTISTLNFQIPKRFEEHLYLIDSGKPAESTGEMVQFLGKRFNVPTAEVDSKLNRIEKVTKKMTLAIIQENSGLFAQCLSENEKLLEELDLVSESTRLLLTNLTRFGTGKITGAGGMKKGSGYIVFYADDSAGLEKYLTVKKITCMKFKQNYEGVQKV